MESGEVALVSSAPSGTRRGKLAQVGRGLLAVVLLLQTLFCLGFGAAGLWGGLAAIGSRPAFPGDWPWYQTAAGGAFLALAGAASMVALAALVQDRQIEHPQGIRWLSIWVVIAFEVLLPAGTLLFLIVASPGIDRGPYLVPSWLFWQFVCGLVALGVWTMARQAGFGRASAGAVGCIALVGIALLTAVLVGGRSAASDLVASLGAGGPFGPCTVERGSCWQTVNVANAQHAADRFGAPVAWIPEGKGVTPYFIRVTPSSVVENARLNGSAIGLILVSYPNRIPLCSSSLCTTAQFEGLRHTRVWVYSRPDGSLELAWAVRGRSYRLFLISDVTRALRSAQGVSVFGMVRYAVPLPSSVLPIANQFYGYWKANDRAGARDVASRQAVAQLFGSPWRASFTVPSSCTTDQAGGFDCDSLRTGADLFMLVARRPGTSSYWVLRAVACRSNPCFYIQTP